MKKNKTLAGLFMAFLSLNANAEKFDFSVAKSDISNGYIIKKIWLKNYAEPKVVIANTNYQPATALPVDAIPSDANKYDLLMGMERKRPFVLVRIPAYAADGMGLKLLTTITIDVTEAVVNASNNAMKTTGAVSPLATGNWYKIAVTDNGFYKVDYNFVSSKLGVSGNINSANIRVFGNGGIMLPENNAVAHKTNLTEVAILVNDGGDGSFGPGDYFLFYGRGIVSWAADTSKSRFNHQKNLYEDKGYYFLNFDAPGARVAQQPSGQTPTTTVNSYNDYQLHEADLYNPAQYGKNWVGEDFGFTGSKVATRSFDFELGNLTGNMQMRVVMASRSESNANVFTVFRNGAVLGSYMLNEATGGESSPPLTIADARYDIAGISGKQTIRLDYQSASNGAVGYLDFIEINTRRALTFDGNSFLFRDLSSVGATSKANYQIANSDASVRVWDITDPYNAVAMNGSLTGNTYSFTQDATTLHEFAAIKGDIASQPEYIGRVDNQNLHGLGATDFVIVTHPDFISAANRLADFHKLRSNMRVAVVTTTQVYNEFSSGGQDISAIRDFVKMLYDNAGTDTTAMPRYLLMFGDASYDYKSRVSNNTNFVPTFESEESIDAVGNYCGDDFFGFLDNNEYIENLNIANTLDVGVGRLTVKNIDEANSIVDKIIHYKSPSTLGPWRLSTTIVADNEDNAGPHLEDGEIMDATITSRSSLYNSTKIYEDAIPFISTPGGQRAPEANKAINDQMFRGTFLLNYSGHGNPEVLSHERIITGDDYNKWNSYDKLPIMVTATCDFGQFDRPDFVSSAEQIVLKKDGGAISSITTVKLVYQSPNRKLNQDYLDAQFQRVNGRWNTFGDALRIGKNKTYSNSSTSMSDIINFRKFALLGDPALEPNFPEFYIYTQNISDGITGKDVDTINALGSYVVYGIVGDINGHLLSNFNGRLNVVIYDKPRTVKTITNINKTFSVRSNIIYRGKATVTDGRFSVAFIAPKDINYDMGKGKISYYAENGTTDAAGADFRYSIGGYSDHPVLEETPPIVRPYIGDSLFVNGGLTGSNTLLFAILEDETGINVSGNAVGHDLTAVMDGNTEAQYVLNDYYETETNTYKRGYVNFPMYNLAEGRHRIVVKAWDVNNNSGTGTVDFEVANGNIMKVKNLMNYPNPFRDKTHFIFEHNHPDEYLYAEINIYNTSGVLVRTIKQVYQAGAGRSKEIEWDGTDTNGALLQSGVYIYKMMITTDKGTKDMAYQKLVIAR